MGGTVPGLLMVTGLWLMWKFLYRNHEENIKPKQSGAERWQAFKKLFSHYCYRSLSLLGCVAVFLLQQKQV